MGRESRARPDGRNTTHIQSATYPANRQAKEGRREVTSALDDRRLIRMAVMDVQLHLDSWQYVGALVQLYNCVLHQFFCVYRIVDCVQEILLTDRET